MNDHLVFLDADVAVDPDFLWHLDWVHRREEDVVLLTVLSDAKGEARISDLAQAWQSHRDSNQTAEVGEGRYALGASLPGCDGEYLDIAMGFTAADTPDCGPAILAYAATQARAERFDLGRKGWLRAGHARRRPRTGQRYDSHVTGR